MAFALTGARLFDGLAFREELAVVVEGPRIVEVIPANSIAPGLEEVRLSGGLLAPGFIDVQVNGGGGALLNNSPNPATVRKIADSHRRYGTVGMLPTVVTDTPAVTDAAIAAVRKARADGAASVLGIHVEGPFLDSDRKGAHDGRHVRQLADVDVMKLATADCGVLMLTLAPNKVTPQYIARLAAAGVKVSLGHAEATYAEVRTALEAGACSFTHLFNAMSQLSAREPGMVGAALADDRSFIGFIADGLHVHDASMRVAIRATSPERFMLVTDAMPPAADGPDRFELQGRAVLRVNGRLQLTDGTLAGSNLTMDAALRHCVQRLGLTLEQSLQMASRNPARFLGRGDLGLIAPGALASLVHLDEDLKVVQTWVEGT